MAKLTFKTFTVDKPKRQIIIPKNTGQLKPLDLVKARKIFTELRQKRERELIHAR